MPMEPLLTVQQLSEYLGVQPSTVYHWTHEGFVPHYKVGDTIRFKSTEIERWMQQRRVAGRPKQLQEVSL